MINYISRINLTGKYIFAALLLPFLVSCEKTVDLGKFRDAGFEKLTVINSILNPDSVVTAVATSPYFYSDVHQAFSYIKDLDMRLDVNGAYHSDMEYDNSTNRYISTYRPVDGDVIRLTTFRDGITLTAEDTMPRSIPIEDVSFRREGPMHIYWDNDFIVTYDITFSDPADEENYYFLAVKNSNGIIFKDEYVFGKLKERINISVPGWEAESLTGLPFSDEGIDGKRYTLTVNEIFQFWQFPPMGHHGFPEAEREIMLYSISRAYYNYMVSLLMNDEGDSLHGALIGLGIAEPVEVYSNIEGGSGILGCYHLDRKKVIIPGD